MLSDLSGTGLLVFVVLCALVPIISALLTRAPSWLTGLLTLVQAAIIGLVAEWAAGGAGFNWRDALLKALLAVAFAVGSRKVLTAGRIENTAHAKGLQAGPAS